MIAAWLLAAGAVVAPARADVVERIAVRVNGDVISKTEVEEAYRAALAERRSQGATVLGDDDARKLGDQVVERLIGDRLIVQAAVADGIKVTDSEVAPQVDEQLDDLRGRFSGQKAFEAQLRREGLTLDDLRGRFSAQMRDRYLYFKELNKRQRELDAGVEVTDDQVTAYYEAHKDRPQWQTDRQVHARHMLFAVDASLTGEARKAALAEARKKAAAAQAALARKTPFAEVARTLSDDAATKADGGDLGTFSAGTYHEAIEKAAFALKPGQVSEPVESPVGLHLVTVEDVVPPHPRGLDDKIRVPAPPGQGDAVAGEPVETTIREQVKAQLRRDQTSKALEAWVAKLKAGALIQRFPEAAPKS